MTKPNRSKAMQTVKELKPGMLGLVPIAMRLTKQQLRAGWTAQSLNQLANFPAAISDGGNRWLSGAMDQWVPPEQAAVWTVGYLWNNAALMEGTSICIFAGKHKIRFDDWVGDDVRRILRAEPLNPTGRMLAAKDLPEPIPDEIQTWPDIVKWLADGFELELPPIPDAVLDSQRPKFRVSTELRSTVSGACKYFATRCVMHEEQFNFKEIKALARATLAEGGNLENLNDALAKIVRDKQEKALLAQGGIEKMVPWPEYHHDDYVPNQDPPEITQVMHTRTDQIAHYIMIQLPEEWAQLNKELNLGAAGTPVSAFGGDQTVTQWLETATGLDGEEDEEPDTD